MRRLTVAGALAELGSLGRRCVARGSLREKPRADSEIVPVAVRIGAATPRNTSGMAVETAIPEVCLSGNVLVSHTVPRAVPSALKGLTSGFGMEPGVSLSP
jgi:hypothetical protein